MNARDQLRHVLRHAPVSEAVVEEIVDIVLAAHARELAERIRTSKELRDLTDDHMGDCNAAADLIDPGEG